MLTSCSHSKKEDVKEELDSLLLFDTKWQNKINQNMQNHADGEDFDTKYMIGIDL